MTAGIRLSFEEVKGYFEQHGCELLETEYKNARTKMRYRCNCGKEALIVYDSFKTGNRCRDCGNRKSAKKQTLSHDYVFTHFKEQGCLLLDQYVSSNIPMAYICNCGKESKISWCNFFSGKKRCLSCGTKKRSGENHYEWREDRELYDLVYTFRQRCYKMVAITLAATNQRKSNRTANLLGYDHNQLKEHLTSHPNWEKVQGGKWHVDHIFPIKAFIDHGISDLKIINSLDNLRPLEATANMSKGDSYNEQEFLKWLETKGIQGRLP